MFIEIGVLVIVAWFFGGVLYRERLFYKAAKFRAEKFNELVKVMETEFGEYNVQEAARKSGVQIWTDVNVTKGKWGSRLGW